MAATRKPRPAAPKPRHRDHEREAANRATSRQVNLSLTADERATLEALALALGAPLKASVLGAARAALALLEGQGAPAARKVLQANLEPAKPGPKTSDEHEQEG